MKRTDHDGLFKELLRTFFVEFVAAFLPNMAQYLEPDSIEFLDKEIIREVTARRKHTVVILVKARFRGEETFFLVHVENQAKAEAGFSERMFDYFSWLRAKYRLPIYPVVIFSFAEPLRPEPNRFRMDFPGETVLNFRYKVIQLNRLPWRRFLKQPNPVATALMTKMKIAPREEKAMQLMTSMRREGIRQGQERIIDRQIKKRFGSVTPEMTERLSALSGDDLDNLGEAMFDFSNLADLESWLSHHQSN